jgi:glycosyltransferase involved in cell wall biosynthesis
VTNVLPSAQPAIAVIYPFFAHYRAPLVEAMLRHGQARYRFLADIAGPFGIEVMRFPPEADFHRTRCLYASGRLIWQFGVLREAMFGACGTYIFLGNFAWPSTWLGAIVARLRGRRVLFWSHGWTRQDSGALGRLRGAFYRIAHGLLLYGERARGIGIRLGFEPDRLHVIYNSLDAEEQFRLASVWTDDAVNRERTRLFGRCELPVVLASARLTRTKRFDLLLAALARLRGAGREIVAVFVGDGPERTPLEAQARSLGVTALFAGACYSEPELARYFACASVTVSPGNVGLTCMHSLGYGVPVITHDDLDRQGPEVEAIDPGRTGELFRYGDVPSLAEAIDRWTRRPLPTAETREACRAVIRQRYHPRVQLRLIEAAALDG